MRAHHGQIDPCPGEPGSDGWIIDGSIGAGKFGEIVEFAGESDLLTQRGDATLELQQSHRNRPAVAGRADDQIGVGDCVVEKTSLNPTCR